MCTYVHIFVAFQRQRKNQNIDNLYIMIFINRLHYRLDSGEGIKKKNHLVRNYSESEVT